MGHDQYPTFIIIIIYLTSILYNCYTKKYVYIVLFLLFELEISILLLIVQFIWLMPPLTVFNFILIYIINFQKTIQINNVRLVIIVEPLLNIKS